MDYHSILFASVMFLFALAAFVAAVALPLVVLSKVFRFVGKSIQKTIQVFQN